MEIVLSALRLGAVGGLETYVITVGEQLQAMGHGVTVFAPEVGDAAALAIERGLDMVSVEDELPETCDVVIANDVITSYSLAARYALTPQVFVVHGDEYEMATPPHVPDVVQAAVVLNDRVGRRVRALANVPDLVRLRQPIDTKRFFSRLPLNQQPKRALMLGNWARDDRRQLVSDVCGEFGIECVQIGHGSNGPTSDPELEIGAADIVFGKARVILEAMSSGRAAYVYDHNGGDGWVTPERYELLEADNFGGQAEPAVIDAERLRRDLADYDPAMGPANRDLVVAHHSANRHAQALVEVCRTVAPREHPVDAPLRELARLARLAWAAEWRALHWAGEVQRQAVSGRNYGLDALQEELMAVRGELAMTRLEVATARQELDHGRREVDRGRAELDQGRHELNAARAGVARLLRPWRWGRPA
jgi:hypothetical protein